MASDYIKGRIRHRSRIKENKVYDRKRKGGIAFILRFLTAYLTYLMCSMVVTQSISTNSQICSAETNYITATWRTIELSPTVMMLGPISCDMNQISINVFENGVEKFLHHKFLSENVTRENSFEVKVIVNSATTIEIITSESNNSNNINRKYQEGEGFRLSEIKRLYQNNLENYDKYKDLNEEVSEELSNSISEAFVEFNISTTVYFQETQISSLEAIELVFTKALYEDNDDFVNSIRTEEIHQTTSISECFISSVIVETIPGDGNYHSNIERSSYLEKGSGLKSSTSVRVQGNEELEDWEIRNQKRHEVAVILIYISMGLGTILLIIGAIVSWYDDKQEDIWNQEPTEIVNIKLADSLNSMSTWKEQVSEETHARRKQRFNDPFSNYFSSQSSIPTIPSPIDDDKIASYVRSRKKRRIIKHRCDESLDSLDLFANMSSLERRRQLEEENKFIFSDQKDHRKAFFDIRTESHSSLSSSSYTLSDLASIPSASEVSPFNACLTPTLTLGSNLCSNHSPGNLDYDSKRGMSNCWKKEQYTETNAQSPLAEQISSCRAQKYDFNPILDSQEKLHQQSKRNKISNTETTQVYFNTSPESVKKPNNSSPWFESIKKLSFNWDPSSEEVEDNSCHSQELVEEGFSHRDEHIEEFSEDKDSLFNESNYDFGQSIGNSSKSISPRQNDTKRSTGMKKQNISDITSPSVASSDSDERYANMSASERKRIRDMEYALMFEASSNESDHWKNKSITTESSDFHLLRSMSTRIEDIEDDIRKKMEDVRKRASHSRLFY